MTAEQQIDHALAYFTDEEHLRSFELLDGVGQVLISAPHAMLQTRNGCVKCAERFTGMLCRLMHERINCPVIYKTRHLRDDANHDPVSDYRDALCRYVNTHGTSTPVGDVSEVEAIRRVFGADHLPLISSTKSLSGHSQGATGVHEAIYSLLMLRDGFIAGSANIENLDPRCEGFPIVRESRDAQLHTVMSNSFGFGGTNATLVFGKV